jgi:hypothetical protein
VCLSVFQSALNVIECIMFRVSFLQSWLHRIVQINAVSYSKWGRLGSPVPGSRGPRKNWILYKFERNLAVGGPRKDGSGSRSAETY